LRRAWRTIAIVAAVALITGQASPGAVAAPAAARPPVEKLPPLSGAYEYGRLDFGMGLTECPQAGKGFDRHPQPLDRRVKDAVEQKSEGSSDLRANQDFSCFPQDETSIAANPQNGRNVLGGANDYRLGWGTSGFYTSTNSGSDWYDGIIPFPSIPVTGDNLDGGGDPAIVFDRAGVAYYADINFNRTDDTSGVFVSRSTNGGFTWSRPCVSFGAACGLHDPRRPGDGVVVFTQDNDPVLNGSVPAHDKEYIAAGPRPGGVTPQCFSATHAPTPCDESLVGVDRLYVTWTIFGEFDGVIAVSYSDDQARSWSAAKPISGSAAFCTFGVTERACDANQFSTPTVNPHTGYLYVAFENFNTEDENQYLLVRSHDGGATFQGPFFVTPVFDVNYPRAGLSATRNRPDCTARGQNGGRAVLTNSCFRVNSGGNVVVDKRGGAFADDLYLVMSDNRNGTKASSNTDVFLFKSTNGGETWIGPTRVNDDPSSAPANRDCTGTATLACPANVHTGNDQWFPWVDIGEHGDLVVVFEDRRLDTTSTTGEWPTSRSRTGNYLVWYWGARCTIDSTAAVTTTIPAAARDCLAPSAAVITQPTAPFNPSGAFPGAGPAFVGPFDNFGISDIPSNWDYTFRAGIFAGDYSNVTVVNDRAHTLWTDARNGRSSRTQAGRNPICEQSDVFYDSWDAHGAAKGQNSAQSSDALFLVTPCPSAARDNGNRDNNQDGDTGSR
jgi:hypothetical protein